MSSLLTLVNGVALENGGQAIAVGDRGLNYGDGLFETALLRSGSVRFLNSHLARLQRGCERLGIPFPVAGLTQDLLQMERMDWGGQGAAGAVLKIVVTRGVGGRGYRPAAGMPGTRIVALHPLPDLAATSAGISARWCSIRLSRNAALAGMKHLNRLEQVLAQREWDDEFAGEGLMLDTEGELIGGTASNVFVVRDGGLSTPDLRFCGVFGIMREQVLWAAGRLGVACSEEPLWPHDLASASEVFVTNAVRGIRSITALDTQQWPTGPVARRLIAELDL